MSEEKHEMKLSDYIKEKTDEDRARTAEVNKRVANYRLRAAKVEMLQHILMVVAIAVLIFVIAMIGTR